MPAIFTPEQIESIEAFQDARMFHPFTCGNAECREVLKAEPDGMTCPKCGYKQTWVHKFMADWSWKTE